MNRLQPATAVLGAASNLRLPPRLGARGLRFYAVAAIGGAVLGSVGVFSLRISIALLVAAVVLPLFLVRVEVLLVALALSVFVEVISVGGLTVTRISAPIAFLVIVIAIARGALRLRWGAPLTWATLYSAWACASLFWTTAPAATEYLLASLGIAWVYVLAFNGLIANRRVLVIVLATIAAVALGVALFALASFFGLGGAKTLQEGRASGAAGDANFFAAYQLVALPLILVLSATVESARVRLGLYVAAAVVVASVLTTLSRGGLFTLAFVIIVALFLPSRTIFRSGRQKLVTFSLLTLGLVIAVTATSGKLAPRIGSIFSGQDTGSGRTILWSAAQTSIDRHPFLGLGYGAFPSNANSLILQTPGVSLRSYALRPHGEEVHSAFIGTTAELGVPGLVLFIGLLGSTAWSFRRTAMRAVRTAGGSFTARIANAALLSLAGWAIASLFLSSETSRPLWIMVGLAGAIPRIFDEERAVRPAQL